MASKVKCYSPTCSNSLSPFQDKCYSAVCPDRERTLLTAVDPEERKNLIELRKHQKTVLGQLQSLQTSVENLKNTVRSNVKDEQLLLSYQDTHEAPSFNIRDIVIKAPPSNPPLSVIVIKSLLQTRFKVKALAHVHSDVEKIDHKLKTPFKPASSTGGSEKRSNYDLGITIIWKHTQFNKPQLILNNKTPIIGEVNIARYFKRLLEVESISEDLSGALKASAADAFLDSISIIIERQDGAGVDKEKATLVKALASRLSSHPHPQWISSQECLGIDDILAWRVLFGIKAPANLPKTVADWMDRCKADPIFQEAIDLLR